MGIKTAKPILRLLMLDSEKPPHHMGIKTLDTAWFCNYFCSENPPHHMGIKTLIMRPPVH